MTTFFWADNFEKVYYWINKKLLKTESAKLRGLRGLVGRVGHVDTWVRGCVDDVGRKFAWFTWFAWVYKILAWVWHFACLKFCVGLKFWRVSKKFAWVWNFTCSNAHAWTWIFLFIFYRSEWKFKVIVNFWLATFVSLLYVWIFFSPLSKR